VLTVEDLYVRFVTEDGVVRAVDGVSFELYPGEVLAIVGESGSGKSVTAQTVMGLTRADNAQFSGRIVFEGRDLLAAGDEELRAVRGNDIAMVFQDPMTSLNPVYRIGWQIAEQIRAHEDVTKAQARDRAVALLREVGIPRPETRAGSYPHELSGGMRQRALIAMALACQPRVVIADEPTTALDVTIQAQILELLRRLRGQLGSVILITHDLGVVADIADRVLVMYAGMAVEQGTSEEIFYDPQHPYTWGLIGSLARVDGARPRRLPSIPGQPPSLINRPQGCPFRPRCPHAFDQCRQLPGLEVREGLRHPDRCWLPADEKRSRRVVEDRIGLTVDAA
jgi:oligopeptide/dipeptide ABC transporter ATP-binding protein